MIRAVVLLAALAVFTSTTAQSQARRSTGGGLTVGGGLIGTSVSSSADDVRLREYGRGLNVEIGWGFTAHLAGYLGINRATISSDFDYSLNQTELGLRYLFRGTDKRVRPYLEGAAARRTLRTDFFGISTVKGNSPSVLFGGGVQLFVSPKVALDLGLNHTLGTFSGWTENGLSIPEGDEYATSTNIRIGVRFWPSNR